jgi:ribosomal protein S12 methylthiotransferase accessory factor
MRPAAHAGLLAQLGPSDTPGALEWVGARSLLADARTEVPADLCFMPSGNVAPSGRAIRLGGGCAAGESPAHATLAALLELVERDAAALWWVGGERPQAIGLEVLHEGGAAALIGELRQGIGTRRSWVLDISTDIAVPCAAAVSVDESGRSFACGLAARTSLEAAAKAAILELCQMELANYLVRLKLETGGEAALAAADLRTSRRMEGIDAARCALLFATGAPAAAPPAPERTVAEELRWVVDRLGERKIECFAVDLTRKAIGVPCVQVLAPSLQTLPLRTRTARLEAAIARTGGGAPYTGGIELL